MKRLISYIFAIILTLSFAGCSMSEIAPSEKDTMPLPEGEALLSFGLNLPGADLPETKAMADKPGDITLRLAVFGSTGFLKEYVEAEPDATRYPEASTGIYYFKARLSLSEQTRNIHLIANGPTSIPFLSEDEVLAGIYGEGDQDIYWQRIRVENGIVAKKTWNEVESIWQYERSEDGKTYIIDESVTEKFRDIKLIRNFANITVTSAAPNFELDPDKSFIIMNKPDRGSVAPYNTRTGEFITDYHNMTYQQIKDSYDGYMPINTTVGKDNSTDVNDFKSASTGDYLYERTKPTSSIEPTYLLIHGTYYADDDIETKENGIECFYKVNLMDQDGYYTIYRNFHYRIIISKVAEVGSSTADDANNTGGTGDITINTEAEDLTDVSDGSGRIYVSYTHEAYPTQQTGARIQYKFIPNVEDGIVDNDAVDITINAPNAYGKVFADKSDYTVSSTQTLIGDDGTGYILRENSDDADGSGWRTITYNTTAPSSNAIKSQTITIVGHSEHGTLVSRDVEVILLERQKITVTCRNKYVEKDASTAKIPVDISIPKNLPEAMFPLVFDIESDKGTITPDPEAVDENGNKVDNNLPVSSGPSLDPDAEGAVNFQFKRTLSYEEYLRVSAGNGDKATFTCYFIPNKDESACTIYVANKEFFETGYDWFGNYYKFSNLMFDVWNTNANNTPVNFTFSTEEGARPSIVVVTLEGLEPAANSGLTRIGNSNQYYYSTPNTDNHSLALIYKGSGSLYSVSLSTLDSERYIYMPASRSSEDAVFTPVIVQKSISGGIDASDFDNGTYTFTDGDVSITVRFSSATDGNDYIEVTNNSTLSVSGTGIYSLDNISLNYYRANNNNYYSATISIDGSTTDITNGNQTSTWRNANTDNPPTDVEFRLARRNTRRNIRVTDMTISYSVIEYSWQLNE